MIITRDVDDLQMQIDSWTSKGIVLTWYSTVACYLVVSRMYLHVLCSGMFLTVLACIACMGKYCMYVFVFGLVCIAVYLHVLYVLARPVSIGISYSSC